MFEHLLAENKNVRDALDLSERDKTFIGALITFVNKYEKIRKV